MYHHGPIAGIAASGKHIATAGYDNQVILWNGAERKALARGMHDHLVNQCAFSNDGALLVSASSDYSARIWHVPSLQLKAVLLGHSDDVDMAVFSPDDQRIATCALDRTLRIFDLQGHCLNVLEGHSGNIISIAWSHDGRRLVSSSVDGSVREWDAASGAALRCNQIDVRTDTLAIDRLGRIFAGDDDGRIIILIDGESRTHQAHQAGIKKLLLDEANATLITLGYDRCMAIWRIDQDFGLQPVAQSEIPAQVWARSAALIDAGHIALGTFGSSYGIYDLERGQWDMSGIEADPGLNAVTFFEQEQYAIGDAGVLWRAGQAQTQLGSLCNFLLAAGPRLLSGGQLGQLFDACSGEVLFQHHSPLNCAVSFQRQGRLHLAVGTYTGEALIFAMDENTSLHHVSTLKIYRNAIKGLSANQQQLFSVCASTAVAWHDLNDLRLVARQDHAHERIANGCCQAGAHGFASIGRDRMLRVWDGERQQAYRSPHPNSIKCICADTEGKRLMTGAYSGTLAAFDLESRSWSPLSRPTAAGISALAYDPQSKQFVASSYDGHIYRVD
jgi:WD40 repeat protein